MTESLDKIAARLRRAAGRIDLPRLVDELRGRFELRDFPDHRAEQENVADDAVITLLVHVWDKARDALRQDVAAFAAFRGLLEQLVSRQNATAFELADRVGAMRH